MKQTLPFPLAVVTGRLAASSVPLHVQLHWYLRLACAFCFVGHGAWGVITKAEWLPFFSTLGIDAPVAWKLMPLVGSIDIALGILVLFRPMVATLTWMVFWGVFTALLRPMTDMGWWEFLERAGNYGPPLALLLLAPPRASGGWFAKISVKDTVDLSRVELVLRVSIALLLIGHGGFGLVQVKTQLMAHWQAVGIDAGTAWIRAVGAVEIVLGMLVLFARSRSLLMAVLYWKLITEFLYPVSGGLVDTWEWVERGGDYFAPLALIAVMALQQRGGLAAPTSTMGIPVTERK